MRSSPVCRQLAEITSADLDTLLAATDRLAGFAQLKRGEPPACVTETRPVELYRFYVDRPWHGRGVAGRLMSAALDEAAAAGATAVWLGVWERNPRAIAFYRKWEFADVGTQPLRLGNDVQTDRVMARGLG